MFHEEHIWKLKLVGSCMEACNKNDNFKREARKQIIALFFIKASSATAFAVFYSGLSIFLTQKHFYTKEHAALITSLFLSFNYFLPLIGGLIANKIVTYKKLFFIGTLASFSGCFLLAFSKYLFLGLALFLMNSLVTNVCLNMFLTQLFTVEQKSERRVAFMWNYVGSNLGFMMGFLLTGFSTIANNFSYLFVVMGILVFLASILNLIFIKEPNLKDLLNKGSWYQLVNTFSLIVILVISISLIFANAIKVSGYIIFLSFMVSVFIIKYAFEKTREQERIKVIKFVGFSGLSIIFWTMYMLTPIAIMQLIANDVDRNFHGFVLAPQWFVNIDSAVILLITPLLTYIIKKNSKASSLSYFSYSLIFVISGFIALLMGLNFSVGYSKIPLFFIISYLVLLTMGEIFISPTGNALIGELIPESLRGLMTGSWSMNIGIGGLLSGCIANKFILPYINSNGLSKHSSVELQGILMVLISALALFVFITMCIHTRKLKMIKNKFSFSIK
jgi:POT family proton-dependent oligopeptide transporter